VPAISEALPGFEATAWVGIFAPARTPADVVAKVQHETQRIVRLPDIAQRLRELGATPVANQPSEFAAFVKQDTEKWRALVATAKIQVEQ
jgi:tripartite-type tricarboxylate transporter receptor subunit TctC